VRFAGRDDRPPCTRRAPTRTAARRYYGRFYRSALYPLLRRVTLYLTRWAGKKYKRLRTHKRFMAWWGGLLDIEPNLFAHRRWCRAF
jgi:RNA-directed DNA polymerase